MSAVAGIATSKILLAQNKPKETAASRFYSALDGVKRFGIGVFFGEILGPIALAPVKLAQKTGFIPHYNNREVFQSLEKIPPTILDRVFSSSKVKTIIALAIAIPIFEEVVFRGLIQDVLLKRIPKWGVKKIAPGKETVVDSKIATMIRIVLTSLLFSTCHLVNRGLFPDAYVTAQLIATFVIGLGLGAIKESKLGLLGAIGAHQANNLLAIAPSLLRT